MISRDEGLHRDFAVMLHDKLVNKVPHEVALDIITEAVEIEKDFVTNALPVSLLGMNAKTHVRIHRDGRRPPTYLAGV